MVASFCGLRHGELSALVWPVVDLKRGVITVRRSLTWLKGGPILEPPKTKNAYRKLKIPPKLLAELREWKLKCPPNPNNFVFVNPLGQPTSRKTNNKMLKACCKRAGVRALSMNNLRHSFASQSFILGTPPLKISRMMGHSGPEVTLKIYTRWAETEQSNAEILLEERILNAEVMTTEATGSQS